MVLLLVVSWYESLRAQNNLLLYLRAYQGATRKPITGLQFLLGAGEEEVVTGNVMSVCTIDRTQLTLALLRTVPVASKAASTAGTVRSSTGGSHHLASWNVRLAQIALVACANVS